MQVVPSKDTDSHCVLNEHDDSHSASDEAAVLPSTNIVPPAQMAGTLQSASAGGGATGAHVTPTLEADADGDAVTVRVVETVAGVTVRVVVIGGALDADAVTVMVVFVAAGQLPTEQPKQPLSYTGYEPATPGSTGKTTPFNSRKLADTEYKTQLVPSKVMERHCSNAKH
jgi:hypothetical protein